MDEALIVGGARTPIGRGGRGRLRAVPPVELAAVAIRAALARSGVPAADVEDVVLGCAIPEGEQGLNIGRLAALRAGLPSATAGQTVNRFCASGLEAVAVAAWTVAAGAADVVVAGGVESMSRVPMPGFTPSPLPDLVESWPEVYISMGQTAEEVARRYGVSREDQDAFALESHRRAARARAEGRFGEEIAPVEVPLASLAAAPPAGLRLGLAAALGAGSGLAPAPEGEAAGRATATVDEDECIREDTSLEALARLRPAFREGGSVTAGNSSPTSDGAAALVVVSRRYAEAHGLRGRLALRSFAVAGVDPEVMGIGPVRAVPRALERAGLGLDDVDVVELNEAFASQTLAVMRALGLDPAKVNPNGGAIALGHPLGSTGARQTVTLMHELERRGGRFGLVTMCVGGGMGAAAVFERLGS
ncbi:MAG: thiolase family protein [Clostridia bacterium]|nr:thiolase family protein [Clostridia bacterium]